VSGAIVVIIVVGLIAVVLFVRFSREEARV
jgi:hypothetical protein